MAEHGQETGLRPLRVTDACDPRLEPYRDVRDRDLAGRRNLFLAEGKVVLERLFAAGRFEPESVLILENRLAGMRETLAKAPPAMPVYVASQEVMDRIAGFHIHRGVLAACRRGSAPGAAGILDGLGDDALVVVTVGMSNHDNMGAIFRNAAAFGAAGVLADSTSCDPLYRKAIRVSVGAALAVPFAHGGEANALLTLLEERGFSLLALSPAGGLEVAALQAAGRQALIVGTEGEGLPPAILEATETVRIPISPGIDSLNVATALAIALHRLWRG